MSESQMPEPPVEPAAADSRAANESDAPSAGGSTSATEPVTAEFEAADEPSASPRSAESIQAAPATESSDSAPATPGEPAETAPTATSEPVDAQRQTDVPPPAPEPTFPHGPPGSPETSSAASTFDERPELAVGAAFAGGFALALILKRLAR